MLGLPLRVGLPEEERELMSLYPQPRGRRRPSSTREPVGPHARAGARALLALNAAGGRPARALGRGGGRPAGEAGARP